MRKVLLLATLFGLCISNMMAVPAWKGVKKKLVLANGTTVEATLTGDENIHYYRTADNRALQKVGEYYQYVDVDSLQMEWTKKLQARNSRRLARAKTVRKATFTGKRKGLVILVNFTNLKMGTTKEEWYNYFNQEGYNTAGMGGSVHDYFYEQSYGKFDLEFDVVGPVTMSHPYSYYGSNENNVPAMAADACKLVNSQVNFADYDWDGDGYVDQVYLIYAGYGEAQGAPENTIWPHEWTISSSSATNYEPVTLDGKKIDTYACSCEYHGDGTSPTPTIDGIGTACHEFSHCLGLPDFYDTSGGKNWGMDVWDLLDSGCYNGNSGYVPAAYTAYERNFGGWLEYQELKEPCRISNMPCISDEPVAYIIYNDANANEYYLLQNIQQKGFNSEAYGHGMLIQHVDYDQSAWSSNTVNTSSSHQRMTVFAADNKYGSNGSNASGDPFPGTSSVTSFTDTTSPASTLYNANSVGTYFMSKPIEQIDETNGLISFDFMGGSDIEVPKALEATDVNCETGSFRANWESVADAVSYQVLLSWTEQGDSPWNHALLNEKFEGCYSKISGTSKDIASTLDNYTKNPGWTGECLYRSPCYLRIGNTTTQGWLQTPWIDAPSTGQVTFCIGLGTVGSNTGSASFQITLDNGNSVTYNLTGYSQTTTSDLSFGYFTIPVSGIGDTNKVQVKLSPNDNTFIGGFFAFDGAYTWTDIKEDFSSVKAEAFSGANRSGAYPLDSWQCVKSANGMRRANVTATDTYEAKATFLEFSGLTPAVYTYRVRAVTAEGNSPWSNAINVDLSDATAVKNISIHAGNDSSSVYDFSGRRIMTPRKGIYISNGKKFIVK